MRVSRREDRLPNWNSSAPVSWYQGGFLKVISELCDCRSHTKEPLKLYQDRILPFKPAQIGQVISGIQLEAVAMGFFRCWLMSSLARETWMCS